MEWTKNNWLKIAIGIVLLIIVLQIINSLNTMLNCSSPICKGIGSVLGLPAKIINTVLSGCSTQSDCTQFKDSDSCGNGNGCSWSSQSTTGTCVCTTGLQPGDGGLFSTKCLLGMGLISFLAVSVLGFLAKIALKFIPPKNENIKTTVEKTGKTTEEVTKDVAEAAREESTAHETNLNDRSPGVVEVMASKITNLTALKVTTTAIDGTRGTPAELAQGQIDATNIATVTNTIIEEEAKASGATETQVTEADRVANETIPAAHTLARIQAFQSLNQVPSKNTHAFLMKHVDHHMRKGENIPPHYLAFLKSVEPK
jgi:hypothetical protein